MQSPGPGRGPPGPRGAARGPRDDLCRRQLHGYRCRARAPPDWGIEATLSIFQFDRDRDLDKFYQPDLVLSQAFMIPKLPGDFVARCSIENLTDSPRKVIYDQDQTSTTCPNGASKSGATTLSRSVTPSSIRAIPLPGEAPNPRSFAGVAGVALGLVPHARSAVDVLRPVPPPVERGPDRRLRR